MRTRFDFIKHSLSVFRDLIKSKLSLWRSQQETTHARLESFLLWIILHHSEPFRSVPYFSVTIALFISYVQKINPVPNFYNFFRKNKDRWVLTVSALVKIISSSLFNFIIQYPNKSNFQKISKFPNREEIFHLHFFRLEKFEKFRFLGCSKKKCKRMFTLKIDSVWDFDNFHPILSSRLWPRSLDGSRLATLARCERFFFGWNEFKAKRRWYP